MVPEAQSEAAAAKPGVSRQGILTASKAAKPCVPRLKR